MKYFKIYAIKFHGEVIYVGQTGDSVDARFWKHMHCAVNGYGGSRIPKLQRHIRKHRAVGYTFEMLEIVSKEKRQERERAWIKKHDTQNKCNTTAGGITAHGIEHYASVAVKCLKTGKKFNSMVEAAVASGVSTATVCLHVNGKRPNPRFEKI